MPKINLSEVMTPTHGGGGDGGLPAAFMALDPTAREVLLLHAGQAMNNAEIAQVTGLPLEEVGRLIAANESFLRVGFDANFEPSHSAQTRARRLVAAAAAMAGPARAALEGAAQVPAYEPAAAAIAPAAPTLRRRLCRACLSLWPNEGVREHLRVFWADFVAGSVWMFSRRMGAVALVLGLVVGSGALLRHGVEAVADGQVLTPKVLAPRMTAPSRTATPDRALPASPAFVGRISEAFKRLTEVVPLSERTQAGSVGTVTVEEYSVFHRPTLTYEVRRVERAATGASLTSVLFVFTPQGSGVLLP
jgi:hypothetical protein